MLKFIYIKFVKDMYDFGKKNNKNNLEESKLSYNHESFENDNDFLKHKTIPCFFFFF